MSVLPQLDPDELLPRTNPGQDPDLRQDLPEVGRAPLTDPRQQVSPSGRPATRPDPAQATFRPVQLRKISGNTQQMRIPPKQFKSFPFQLNTKMNSIPSVTPPLEEQPGSVQPYTPAPLQTPVEPVTQSYNYITQQTPGESSSVGSPSWQAPTTPSHGYANLQTASGLHEPVQPYNYVSQQTSSGLHEPVQPYNYAARETPTGSHDSLSLPRRISGFLGIDEMPTTRLVAIAAQAKELATVVVQPQQAATVIMQGEAKKPSKKNWLSFALRAAVTILIFFFLLKGMNWGQLLGALEGASKTVLLIGLFAGILCVFFSAWGWRSAIQAENINADLSRLIALYLVGLGFSHFLPTSMGGDAVKAYYVGRDSGNMAGAASSALTSRITSFIGMLVIAIPGVFVFYKYVTRQVMIEFGLLSVLLLSAIAGALLLATFLPKISDKFLPAKLAKNKLLGKVLEVGTAMTLAARKPRAMLPAMFFGMLFWIASFINYYEYAYALGIKVPLPFYVIAIPFVSIITALPISIGGFGVREGTFVWLFTQIPLSGMHVPPGSALLLSLVMDAQVLFFGLIGGMIYFTMPKKEKINQKQ
ncbi:MAG TPA: lysylphosphatidylglycerol synthase transmembrane domain-containing protein [Ktedonosporobacter sp.]|nr:lysylphosphatidylglycerol synthase transmembrane domain-containing protein [Ktedonosporobacter sp.]